MRSSIEAGERDECILEILMAGMLTKFVRPAVSDHASRGDHDNRVAECRHFLHDVAREQHATALVAKSPNDRAHGARAHHVEAVGGFVEQ